MSLLREGGLVGTLYCGKGAESEVHTAGRRLSLKSILREGGLV